jgi:hypothetical protein
VKAAKILLILAIVIGILSISLSACSWDEDHGATRSSIFATPRPGEADAYDLTATYGAEQLHVQLTAIADNQVMGRAAVAP